MKHNTSFHLEKLKKFLYYLKDKGGVFQFIFSGGEPLLYKNELLELMDILNEDSTGLLLITNGYLLDSEYIIKLKKYNWYWIQLSLDSYRSSIHDKIRGVKGSFEKVITDIKCLKDAKLPVAISSVICSENLYDIEGIVNLCLSLDVDAVMFSEALPIGRALKNFTYNLNHSQKEYFYSFIEYLTKKYSSQILIRSAQPYDEQQEISNVLPPIGLLIGPNGDVKLDCLSTTIEGNIYETPIDVIWEHIFKKWR